MYSSNSNSGGGSGHSKVLHLVHAVCPLEVGSISATATLSGAALRLLLPATSRELVFVGSQFRDIVRRAVHALDPGVRRISRSLTELVTFSATSAVSLLRILSLRVVEDVEGFWNWIFGSEDWICAKLS